MAQIEESPDQYSGKKDESVLFGVAESCYARLGNGELKELELTCIEPIQALQSGVRQVMYFKNIIPTYLKVTSP